VVSKSGGNQFHGDVYDYVKNSVLNAHNFFDKPGSAKAPLNYNQYGFTLGGPVVFPKLYNGRNKTFFFGSYEKINQKIQSSSTTTVLTPAMEAGDFSALATIDPTTGACTAGVCIHDPFNNNTPYPFNKIPASELASASAQIAAKYEAYVPAPNVPGAVTNNLFNVYYPNTLYVAQSLERVDENLGDKVKLFVRYHWQNLQATRSPRRAAMGRQTAATSPLATPISSLRP